MVDIDSKPSPPTEAYKYKVHEYTLDRTYRFRSEEQPAPDLRRFWMSRTSHSTIITLQREV